MMEGEKPHKQETSQQEVGAFGCATCGASFTSEANLDEHTRKDHVDFANLNQ